MSKKNKPAHKPSSREKLLATRIRVRKRRLVTAIVGVLILTAFLIADYLRDIPGEWYALTLWIFRSPGFSTANTCAKSNRICVTTDCLRSKTCPKPSADS